MPYNNPGSRDLSVADMYFPCCVSAEVGLLLVRFGWAWLQPLIRSGSAPLSSSGSSSSLGQSPVANNQLKGLSQTMQIKPQHLLTYHWPKQVTWPSTQPMGAQMLLYACWEALSAQSESKNPGYHDITGSTLVFSQIWMIVLLGIEFDSLFPPPSLSSFFPSHNSYAWKILLVLILVLFTLKFLL